MTDERDHNVDPREELASPSGSKEAAEASPQGEPQEEVHTETSGSARPGPDPAPGPQPRRLYRSRDERILAGVAGGVAEYFHVDPTLVRILWVCSAFLGIGFLAYFVGWIVVPERPVSVAVTPSKRSPGRDRQLNWMFGGVLILAGVVLLARQLGFYMPFGVHFDPEFVGALLLIGFGAYLMLSRSRDSESAGQPATAAEGDVPPAGSDLRRLTRSRSERKLGGVCGGLAQHFNTDPSLIRVGFVIFALVTKGFGALVYFALAIFVPEEPQAVEASSRPVEAAGAPAEEAGPQAPAAE